MFEASLLCAILTTVKYKRTITTNNRHRFNRTEKFLKLRRNSSLWKCHKKNNKRQGTPALPIAQMYGLNQAIEMHKKMLNFKFFRNLLREEFILIIHL